MLIPRLRSNDPMLLVWEMYVRNGRRTGSEICQPKNVFIMTIGGENNLLFFKPLLHWVSGTVAKLIFKQCSELHPNSLLLDNNTVDYTLSDRVSHSKLPKS